MQCWTDSRGQRACGDTVPPSAVRGQREVINPRGVIKRVLPAQRSDEQIAADAREREQQRQQDAYDRYLLQSYRSVAEIEQVRDARLAALDSRLALAQKALADNGATLDDLHQRVQQPTPAGEGADPELNQQIQEFSQSHDETVSAINRIRSERNEIAAKFARDAERYRMLSHSGASSPH